MEHEKGQKGNKFALKTMEFEGDGKEEQPNTTLLLNSRQKSARSEARSPRQAIHQSVWNTKAVLVWKGSVM